MFGRLHYSPDEYYRMTFQDMLFALEGYGNEEIAKLNRLRHIMWASLAAINGKSAGSPQKLIPLPTDNQHQEPAMSKEDFLALAKKLADMDRNKMGQA